MRTRPYDWLDTRTNTPMYGVQVLVLGKWRNACDIIDGQPVPTTFKTEYERDAYRMELRKTKP